MSRSIDHIIYFPPGGRVDPIRQQFDQALLVPHREAWWQDYLCQHLPALLPQYRCCIPKVNIGIGQTRFPDFLAVTKSGYIDVLEIKRPSTPLLQLDRSRRNYFWNVELSMAISQVEHYLALCGEFRLALIDHLRTTYQLDASIVRPQGVIIAGNTRRLRSQRERDDFRLLAQSAGQIRIMAYDEIP